MISVKVVFDMEAKGPPKATVLLAAMMASRRCPNSAKTWARLLKAAAELG